MRDFRQACLLKRAGKVAESARVLDDTLPKTIAAWSQSNPQNGVAKRAELAAMFQSEQRKIDEALEVQHLAARQAMEALLPTVRSSLMRELKESVRVEVIFEKSATDSTDANRFDRHSNWNQPRQRIKFDDIPGVINAVQTEQLAEYGTQPAGAL